MTSKCCVCKSEDLQVFASIPFGVWNSINKALIRDTQNYDLVECGKCRHVQIAADYTPALFETLYFHSNQEHVLWHESLVDSSQAYTQMAQFACETLPASANVADFGCGTGLLLTCIRQHHKDIQTCFGIDFNPRCDDPNIQYISADLNRLEELNQTLPDHSLDLACASHTLEHLCHPYSFLQSIRKKLKPKAQLFIEVPDFSEPLAYQHSGQSNLVNLQHVQYFTLSSLTLLAKMAGYDVVQSKQFSTGYIPRLQVLLRPSNNKPPEVLQNNGTTTANAKSCVLGILEAIQKKYKNVISKIENTLQTSAEVGLWGIGADCYAMLQASQAMQDLLKDSRVRLFDYALAKHSLYGKEIESSETLNSQSEMRVYMLPILAETRVKMHKAAMQFTCEIIDPYLHDLLDCEDQKTQWCHICKTNDWQKLDTLKSGIWATQAQVLSRQELSFDVGLCRQCNHVQMMTPYTANLFEKLYFSDAQQPAMFPPQSGQKSPYYEMVECFVEYLENSVYVADFGCGEGKLLREIKQAKPHVKAVGLDFNIQGEINDISRFECDLNKSESIAKCADSIVFDIITSSHVPEHVLSPIDYLRALGKRLSANGVLFIEVPNCSNVAAKEGTDIHQHVHGQHIHYYSQDSLCAIAQQAGLQIIKQKALLTQGIPRLQMLFSLEPIQTSLPLRINETAALTVTTRFKRYNEKLAQLASSVYRALEDSAQCALWGIGADFYALVTEYSEIQQALEQGKIRLFDYNHAEKSIFSQTINSSDQLKNYQFDIITTPMLQATRGGMHEYASSQNKEIIDPYS